MDIENIITPPLPTYVDLGEPLIGMVIVFSGNKQYTQLARQLGATVDKTVTKRTTLVVVDKPGTNNEKKGIQYQIPIVNLKEFEIKYLNMGNK